MILYSSLDNNFPYKACDKLYNENKKYNISSLEFDKLIVCLGGNFWAVCNDDNNLMGCLYFEKRFNNKWFLSGFSCRKVSKYTATAIHILINHYKIKKIYSETPHRHAKIALLQAGFKKIRYNIYKWEA